MDETKTCGDCRYLAVGGWSFTHWYYCSNQLISGPVDAIDESTLACERFKPREAEDE